jgi:hypothetical protein
VSTDALVPPTALPGPDRFALVRLATATAHAAGALLRRGQRGDAIRASTKSSARDLVTDLDRRARH